MSIKQPEKNLTKRIIWGMIAFLIYFLAGILIPLTEGFLGRNGALIAFSIVASSGTALLVYLDQVRQKNLTRFRKPYRALPVRPKQALLYSAIVYIASIIFFAFGFMLRQWYISWIPFVIAGVIIEIHKYIKHRSSDQTIH